jgi:hypothetical protein
LKRLRHPHIIQMLDFQWDEKWVSDWTYGKLLVSQFNLLHGPLALCFFII